jgi:rod shape-determining protein MreC
MFLTRASRRRAMTYAVLVATSLVLLAFNSNPLMLEVRRGVGFAFAPVQGGLASVTRSGISVVDAISEIDQLRLENRRLQERNQLLEVENAQLQDVRIQNQQLTAILEVKSTLDYETVAAEVISRQVSQYERVIGINQGLDAGISVKDVVVAGGGALVGQVVEAGPNFSRVLLISDTRSTVIGVIESSRATGEVQGQLGGSLLMTKIPSTDTLAIDDTVVTAGIDLGAGVRSAFPKGLVIGRVVDVDRDPNAVVQTAFVAAAATLDKLEYVLVITDYEGGLPLEGPAASPTPGPGSSPSESRSGEATSAPSLVLPSPSIQP